MQKHQELFVVYERGCHDAAMTYTNSFPHKEALWYSLAIIAREVPITPGDSCMATFEELPAFVKWTRGFS